MARSDDAGQLPDLAVLDRHVEIFTDPPTKQLLITPRGVRVVRLLNQAKRAEYLTLRQAEFESPQITAGLRSGLMNRCSAIHQDLIAAGKTA